MRVRGKLQRLPKPEIESVQNAKWGGMLIQRTQMWHAKRARLASFSLMTPAPCGAKYAHLVSMLHLLNQRLARDA